VTEALDDRLKKSTIGLVTLDDFVKTKDELEEEQRQLAARTIAKTYAAAWMPLTLQRTRQSEEGQEKRQDQVVFPGRGR
jgi:protein FAM50